MFPLKSVQQVGALPFLFLDDEIQVLLITTRRRRHWIVPKGWPKKHLSFSESAAEEALEEAGIFGRVGKAPIGAYDYTKRMPEGYDVPCKVLVYPLLVTEHRLHWVEAAERDFKWGGISQAADLVQAPGLSRMLVELEEDDGTVLRSMADAHMEQC